VRLLRLLILHLRLRLCGRREVIAIRSEPRCWIAEVARRRRRLGVSLRDWVVWRQLRRILLIRRLLLLIAEVVNGRVHRGSVEVKVGRVVSLIGWMTEGARRRLRELIVIGRIRGRV
jgi:hypothetical protein